LIKKRGVPGAVLVEVIPLNCHIKKREILVWDLFAQCQQGNQICPHVLMEKEVSELAPDTHPF